MANRIATAACFNTNGNGRYVTTKYPRWFQLLTELPDEVGGGLLDVVSIKKLLEMTPPWNPSGRTDPNDKRSKVFKLSRSIQAVGLNQFPIINNTHVVDGNRRVAAMHLLKKETMAVIYKPKANEQTFNEIQVNNKRHLVAQRIQSWLINPLSAKSPLPK